MKKLFAVTALTLVSTSILAESTKHFNKEVTLDGQQNLEFNVGVGEITIKPSSDGKVHVSVEVESKDGFLNWFSDDVSDADIEIDKSSTRMEFSVTEGDYSETWTVYVPEVNSIDVNMGVGKVQISEINANFDVDNGVGEVEIEADASFYSDVEVDSGVGEAHIKSKGGKRFSKRDFVSSSQSWQGDGEFRISVDVGVGESRVVLN